MFQDKQTSPENENSQEKNLVTDSIPLNLMQTDLEEIRNPQRKPVEKKVEPQGTPVSVLFSEKQKNSPFFSPLPQEKTPVKSPEKPQELAKKEIPIPIKNPAPAPKESPVNPSGVPPKNLPPMPKKEIATGISEKKAENAVLGKIIFIFALFFLLLIIGAGSYYFWIIKEEAPTQIVNNQPSQPISEPENIPANPIPEKTPEPEPVIENKIELSTENLNYLAIDIQNSDRVSLENQINTYLKKAEELKITAPAELILTDLDKNPLSFKVFAEKIGIILPAKISALFKGPFSLFIDNDNNNYRLGLTINSLDNTKLKAEMQKEESKLAVDFSPIFRNPENKDLKTGAYTVNVYKKTTIRFLNVVSPEYLSLDYAIYGQRLVIATTRKSMYSILDYLATPAKEITPTEKTVVPAAATTTTPAAETTVETPAPITNTP